MAIGVPPPNLDAPFDPLTALVKLRRQVVRDAEAIMKTWRPLIDRPQLTRGPRAEVAIFTSAEKRSWRMPPLALLSRPAWSSARRAAMLALRLYLVARRSSCWS